MRRFLKLLAALLGASLCGLVSASDRPVVTYGTTGGTVHGGTVTQRSPGDFQRLITAAPNRSALISDAAKVTQSGSAEFDMLLKRPIVSQQILRGAAIAVKALPIISAGIAVWDLMNEYRVRPDGTGDGLTWDPGQAPGVVSTEQWCEDNALSTDEKCFAGDPLSTYRTRWATYISSQCGSGFTCEGRLYADRGNQAAPLKDYAVWATGPGYTGWVGATPHKTYGRRYAQLPGCPAVPGESDTEVGKDGKCRSDVKVPITPDGAATKDASFPGVEFDPKEVVEDILDRGGDLTPTGEPGALSGPSSVSGPTTTTTTTPGGGGAPVTTTSNTTINITYNNNTWNSTVSNTTNNPDGGSTTTEGPEPLKPCGLPGTPACKIDETGTPAGEDKNPGEDIDDATAGIRAIVADPMSVFPAWPDINWSFSLPTACGVIPLPAFSPWVESIDVCQFQPMFHDVMGLVWTIGALLGAIGLFWRDSLAT